MYQYCGADHIDHSAERGEEMTLKELRERTGLSQSKFAEKVGISVRTYQNYEQEKRNIYKADIETLIRICYAAGCGLEEFITDEECRKMYEEITS